MGSLDLTIEVGIYSENKQEYVLGITAEDVGGAVTDRVKIYDRMSKDKSFQTYIDGENFLYKDGTKVSDWTSGVLAGFDLIRFDNFLKEDVYYTTPIYEIGSYRNSWDDRILFSDYSVNGVVHDTYELVDGYQSSSLVLKTYYRNSNGRVFTHKKFKENQDYSIEDNQIEILSSRKHIGYTNLDTYESFSNFASGSILSLKYFPIDATTVNIFYKNGDDRVTLSRVENIDICPDTDMYYSVDEGLGIIHISGKQYEDLYLKEPLYNTEEDVISVYPSEAFDEYPDIGKIKIGDEIIFYKGKGYYKLYNLTRSNPEYHTKKAKLEYNGSGGFKNKTIYIEYDVIPRIEYEITKHTERSANTMTGELNVSPLGNTLNSKIVQLTSYEPNLAELILEIDKDSLGQDYYGPISFGTDVARLIATALDAFGNPIEGLDIEFEVLEGRGLLSTLISVSNSEGEAYSFYSPPGVNSDMYLSVDGITYENGNTILNVPGLSNANQSSLIYLYQILKHDHSYGTVGDGYEVTDYGGASEPHGKAYLDVLGTNLRRYQDGVVVLYNGDIKYTCGIKNVITYRSSKVEYTRLYLDRYLSISPVGSKCYLLSRDSVDWVSNEKNGVPVVVYSWDENKIHPLTGDDGAYFPLQADEITSNQLVYRDIVLPEPDPTDYTNNLGAYKVIAPLLISFQAKAIDNATGRLVKSNICRLSVTLPEYLTGVSLQDGLPIAHGFRFYTEEFNAGTGLGPANFLTINPATNNFNQLTIFGEQNA